MRCAVAADGEGAALSDGMAGPGRPLSPSLPGISAATQDMTGPRFASRGEGLMSETPAPATGGRGALSAPLPTDPAFSSPGGDLDSDPGGDLDSDPDGAVGGDMAGAVGGDPGGEPSSDPGGDPGDAVEGALAGAVGGDLGGIRSAASGSDPKVRLGDSIQLRQLMCQPGSPPSIQRALSRMEVESRRDRKRLTHLPGLERLLYSGVQPEAAGRLSILHHSLRPEMTVEQFVAVLQAPEAIGHLFGLFDRDGAGYLEQQEWIDLLNQNIDTSHDQDLVEVIETAAYLVCGHQRVNAERFALIIQAKGIGVKIYRAVQERGQVTVRRIMDFIANLSNARPRNGFAKENLEWLEGLFRDQLGDSEELHLEDFKKIVQTKNPFFAERVFQIFDNDNSGTVSLQEFLDAMHQFAGQSHDDKIRFLFKVYDLDGDGLIQHRELQHVMHACMEENGMRFSEEQIEDLTAALSEDADVEAKGAITYEALKAQLAKHEGLLENLSISIDRWLVPPQPKNRLSIFRKLSSVKPYQFSLPYIRNNYAYLAFLFAFLAVNIGLFVGRCVEFRDYPGFYILARACGQALNFTSAFIIAVMLRNVITFARSHGLGSILPLDEHIYFHKVAGMFTFVYSLLHTFAHLCNLAINVVPPGGALHELNEGNFTYAEWLLTMRPGKFGLVAGIANPTGVALMAILTVMVICSQPFVRKKGNFEVFYRTHLLFVPYMILLILHGPNFWKWVIVPGVIYLIERMVRFLRSRTGQGRTYISSGILLPSKVTHLVIRRPSSLVYHPGDYLFVNIPVIAKYEWHPFTISSAPEQDDTLWLHIRAVGGWTNRLYDYFEEEQLKIECMEEVKGGPENCVSEKCQRTLKPEETNIQKIQKSMKKLAISGEKEKERRISFSTKPPEILSDGTENGAFTHDQEPVSMEPIQEEEPTADMTDQHITSLDETTNDPFSIKKVPLLKAISLPDMQHRMKTREKLLALRNQVRSSSERMFDDKAMQRARAQLADLPYLKKNKPSEGDESPQNKSVARSFRYMRRKPTIIAFKTPSQDSLELVARQEQTAEEQEQRRAEEGRAQTVALPNGAELRYPVGKPLEIYLDGPYGTPSSHIFRAQHAVLIGTGIGVTPFASILQSIMHRYWKNCHRCPRCQHEWTAELPASVMNLKKVDFFWINRDQRSFEWFVNLLSQLEIEQAEQGGVMDRFLDMHMYITSALQKTDMKAVGLQLALDLLHKKEKRDMITGLKTRTIAGRPNWNKVFRQIQEQKKGKVTVFFCGPPQLSRTLRYKCDEFGFKFRKENF